MPLDLLVINWQDIENPHAGGAEIHLHEIFGRIVARGNRVTLLCSSWKGAKPRVEIDGLEVHRVGGRHSFALLARRYYRAHLRHGSHQAIIEDINKIPLHSPLWAARPVIALVPHLFGATAFREASPPFAAAVWLAERPLARVYRASPFQVISQSTADDLVARGIRRELVRVIYPGIDHELFNPDPALARFDEPTFVYVGRLKRYKDLETVIDAVAALRESGIRVKLLVAGKGDHESALRQYALSRNPEAVDFLGFISETAKVTLLRRAWATVYPSPKEGWGITNIEAAACGTPALASDSPGLRESVRHETSGLAVRHGDRVAWEGAMRRIITEAEFRERLAAGARAFAMEFSWDKAAAETEAHLREVLAS